jgi:hypothetical protein
VTQTSREPCPECGCPGAQYDGHACEDFAPEAKVASALRRWWREDRPVYLIRGGWQWGWLGQGWNRLALGKVQVWFASGPSPLARLWAQESFLVRFWTAFLPLLALAVLIAWLT